VTNPVDRATLAPIDSLMQDNLDEVSGAVGIWP
jgi:hypothetical protein